MRVGILLPPLSFSARSSPEHLEPEIMITVFYCDCFVKCAIWERQGSVYVDPNLVR